MAGRAGEGAIVPQNFGLSENCLFVKKIRPQTQNVRPKTSNFNKLKAKLKL